MFLTDVVISRPLTAFCIMFAMRQSLPSQLAKTILEDRT
jgi:hypothetical protein